MRKIVLSLLAIVISISVSAQKDTSPIKVDIPPIKVDTTSEVVITEETPFINLKAVRYLAGLCRKDITFDEYTKLEAIMDKWLSEIAESYRQERKIKK